MVPVYTLGFDVPAERSDHYQRHAGEFPECSNEFEYEDAADAFSAAFYPMVFSNAPIGAGANCASAK